VQRVQPVHRSDVDDLLGQAVREQAGGPLRDLGQFAADRLLVSVGLHPDRVDDGVWAAAAGHLVTIGSVGGKLSVAQLLPYSTAKFAAVGFSEGLRAELGHGPVTVTTVVPGLMRTGSYLQARFTGQAGQEFTWFALG
jgi:NAD(P)-dependent dehydrogenase (short-subunit alcohol dehydrogenase family)